MLSERLQSSIHSAASLQSVHIQATREESVVEVERHASVSWAAGAVHLEDPLTVDCRTVDGHSSPCLAFVVIVYSLVVEELETDQRLRLESSQGQDAHSRRI